MPHTWGLQVTGRSLGTHQKDRQAAGQSWSRPREGGCGWLGMRLGQGQNLAPDDGRPSTSPAVGTSSQPGQESTLGLKRGKQGLAAPGS